jgi:hypothetical protein
LNEAGLEVLFKIVDIFLNLYLNIYRNDINSFEFYFLNELVMMVSCDIVCTGRMNSSGTDSRMGALCCSPPGATNHVVQETTQLPAEPREPGSGSSVPTC